MGAAHYSCRRVRANVSATQVKGNRYIFGAYTHCSWPAVKGIVGDPTGKSFLFSLVNASGQAVRFSLTDKDRAIRLASCVSFGADKYEDGKLVGFPNFVLMIKGQAADQKNANFAYSQKDHGAPYQHGHVHGEVCDGTFFSGQYFQAEEIEVYQL